MTIRGVSVRILKRSGERPEADHNEKEKMLRKAKKVLDKSLKMW